MDGPTTRRRRNQRRGAWLLLALLLPMLSLRPALAEKRVALVIGNSAYRSVARLDNPRNDAQLLANTLRSLGFTLVGDGAQFDLDKAALDRTVQAFGAQLAGADVGLFYYAGHGVQVRGENYLIPVDANPTKAADVDFQMLDTNLVLRQMEGAGTRLNIVILDACRNNPFGGRGLAVGRAQGGDTVRLRDTSSGLVSWVCDSTPSLPEVKGRFIGKASNGSFRGENGTEGSPGWSRYDGTIESDGSINVQSEGLSGAKDDPFHRAPGTKFTWAMVGTLEGTSGVATRTDRDCNIKFAKQSVAAIGPALAPAPAAAPQPQLPSAPDVPQADGLFTDQDMQRLKAIAVHDQMSIVPPFKIERPDPKLPAGLRKFVGVWASEIGFGSGIGRQGMLIVTKVDASSQAEGYWVWGAPTGRVPERAKVPAGADSFEGQIAGEKLTGEAGQVSITATLTAAGNLSFVHKPKTGMQSEITLKPVWRLIDAERDAKR